MSLATVSSKGQITLPARIRSEFDIKVRDKVQFIVRNDEIILKPVRSFRELRGSVAYREGDSEDILGKAVSEHVLEMED